MKNTIFLCLAVLCGTANSYAQEGLSTEKAQEYTQLSFDLEGTYQIQMIDTRSTPAITLDTFPQIDALRNSNDVVYLNLTPTIRIMILPFVTINDPNFEWIERIAYVNSSDI